MSTLDTFYKNQKQIDSIEEKAERLMAQLVSAQNESEVRRIVILELEEKYRNEWKRAENAEAALDRFRLAIEHAAKFLVDHAGDSRQTWMYEEARNLRNAIASNTTIEKTHDPSGKFPYYCNKHHCYIDKPTCRFCETEDAE